MSLKRRMDLVSGMGLAAVPEHRLRSVMFPPIIERALRAVGYGPSCYARPFGLGCSARGREE